MQRFPVPLSDLLSLRSPRGSGRRRGSGLIMALIFTGVISAVLASMLRWVLTESSLNQRTMRRLEANNAAEAIAEYGMTQVRYKMENTSTFIANSFTPAGTQALVLPPATLFAGTQVDPTASALTGGAIANVVSAGSTTLYYVDAADPNNVNDPLRGKWIFRRDIPIYARAKVDVPNGPPIYAYVREKISVRGAPLFAHAAFYNMDMELQPGSTMNVYGPVHVNGDIYLSSQGTALNFYQTVTCTGHIYRAWKSFQPSAQGSNNETLGTSPVTFNNRVNTQVAMLAGTVWRDSTLGVSTTVNASNESGGYATQAAYAAALLAGATTHQTAFRTTASTTWNGNVQTAANGVQNYTPVAIGRYVEDPTPADGSDQSVNTGRLMIEPPTAASAGATLYSPEVEAQKYSNQAGLYITIVPASGYTTTTTTSGGNTTVTTNNPSIPAIVTVRAGGAAGPLAAVVPAGLVTYYPYKQTAVTASGNTTYTVNRGLWDQRRTSGQDIVEFDLTKLKTAVAQMQLASGSRTAAQAISSLETHHWTGIVYLEVTSSSTTRLDGSTVIASGGRQVAIRLINGNLPVPTYGSGATAGLTIATNAPVYIQGHFNDTGTSPSASVSKSGEKPAAIAADAITILSANYDDTTSRSAVRPAASADTVVAAALLTGQSPTNKNNSARMSGGAHNLARFLESWSGRAVYIRGSLVALFESRIADEPWRIDYYGAPARNWGFCDLLQNGTFPPGTPRVISFRRVDYTDLTKAEYDAALAGL